MDTSSELITPPAAATSSQPGDKLAERTGWLGKLLAAAGAIVALIYLANPTAGLFELSPDALPGIGNIDEFLFSLLLLYCLQKLGINLLPMLRSGALRPGARPIPPR
jgi:hypothetical protein